jgi:hypothetical protein
MVFPSGCKKNTGKMGKSSVPVLSAQKPWFSWGFSHFWLIALAFLPIHACRCYPFRNHRLVRCLGPQKHLIESPESSPYLRFPREIMWFCSGGAGFELGDILPKANLFNTSYLGFRPPDCCVARFPDGFFQILYVACLQVPVTMLPPDPDLFADNIFDHPIRTVDLDQGNLTTSPPRLYFFLKVKRAVFWTFSIVIGGGL